MSLGREQASQLAGALTGPPERGHWIAPSIRVDQSFQRLNQLRVVLDQRLPSRSGVPYTPNGERWLRKTLDSAIDSRTRESGNTGDAGNPSSPQLLCIEGGDKVLLSLIQVRKQQAVFLLECFVCAHTESITQWASIVSLAHPGFRVVVSCRPLLLYNPLSSAFRPHHLSACSLRIARTRTMVNIRNLIDDVKCFQTVRDLHGPRG